MSMKEELHRIMKVAASLRPRILEPCLRLPFKMFGPVYTGPTMVSFSIGEPFEISYVIIGRLQQGPRPTRVRTAAFRPNQPYSLHHQFMAIGSASSCKLDRMIQTDMQFAFLGSMFFLRLLQTPPRGGRPCPWLTVSTIGTYRKLAPPSCYPYRGIRETPRGKPQGILR